MKTPRLTYEAQTMLKELAIAGHKPMDPFVVPGSGFWAYEAENFKWGLFYRKGKWQVSTNAHLSRIYGKRSFFETKEYAKPETALRHFIDWWLKYNLQREK